MLKLGTLNEAAVRHYLETGLYQPDYSIWQGQDIVEAEKCADHAMRDALVQAVLKRAPTSSQLAKPPIDDLVAHTRSKVLPMVNGLFPMAERPVIMKKLEKSVIFLTSENIESTLRTVRWRHTAWSLANLYLHQHGAELLSPSVRPIMGLSEETSCYLSLTYFDCQSADSFADYLVHEAAHVFHNCKRLTVGLKETRSREFLLNIRFDKRETFAYACEAYSCILQQTDTPQGRQHALAEHAKGPMPGDDVVDKQEYLSILTSAVATKNGWKRILQACAPSA